MTLLFHVDESRDKVFHFHVGLLVDGPDAARAETLLDSVVERAFDQGACRWAAELHGNEIHGRTGSWSRATIPIAVSVFEEALAVLATCSIEVIARGTDLSRFYRRYNGQDPYAWEFSNLLERLNERLRARGEFGIVIADQQPTYRERLQHLVVSARRSGTGGYRNQRLSRILDTAHFVDSRLSRMTQLADMTAFVMRRRASIPTESDPRAEAVMARLARMTYDAVPTPRGQYYTTRV